MVLTTYLLVPGCKLCGAIPPYPLCVCVSMSLGELYVMKHFASFRVTDFIFQQILPPFVSAVACMYVVFVYNSIMKSDSHLALHLWCSVHTSATPFTAWRMTPHQLSVETVVVYLHLLLLYCWPSVCTCSEHAMPS
jgi:hypothetical protein